MPGNPSDVASLKDPGLDLSPGLPEDPAGAVPMHRAPDAATCDATTAGTQAEVAYTADYLFYRAK